MYCIYCKKECKNENSKRNHERLCKHNPEKADVSLAGVRAANNIKDCCNFCNREITKANMSRHLNACHLNPNNTKECPVCSKMSIFSGITCSRSCSNKMFKRRKKGFVAPVEKKKIVRYRTICFEHHGKKCIVCGEQNIVSVHHINEDHSDNRPENLVPLCPTHHHYVHSRYKDVVLPYIEKFLNKIIGV